MEIKNLSEQMAVILNGLTNEQKVKAKACKNMNELIALLGDMGVALPDEMLDAVAGGISFQDFCDEWFARQVDLEIEWGIDMWDFTGQKKAEDQAYRELSEKYAGENPFEMPHGT